MIQLYVNAISLINLDNKQSSELSSHLPSQQSVSGHRDKIFEFLYERHLMPPVNGLTK